jgi:DNA-binding transcriptional regulator YhcF (GntR family)
MTADSPATLSSLRRGPLVELVSARLREQVARGAWPVGSRLPTEAELARQLQVGRSTIREAVRVLAHVGLLETRQRAGTFVRAPAPLGSWDARLGRTEILEGCEVRHALEPRAAVPPAARRTSADPERTTRSWTSCSGASWRRSARDAAAAERATSANLDGTADAPSAPPDRARRPPPQHLAGGAAGALVIVPRPMAAPRGPGPPLPARGTRAGGARPARGS